MSKYHLVTIRPQGFPHSSGSAELRDSLSWALSALGHECTAMENGFAENATNILFHPELLPLDFKIPQGTIFYALEQPSHPNFANVKKLAKGFRVWDYNLANVENWKSEGYDVAYVPFGFTPNLVRIPKAKTQDCDVFFSGWITPRRTKILEELRKAGLTVVAVDTCYGGARDNLISRAKVCLNINHDGRTLFNIMRMSYWMANSKCIVSEISSDQESYKLIDSIAKVPYEELVCTCKELVGLPAVREGYESMAFDVFNKEDYVPIVAAALETKPAVPANPILARYEYGCQEGDMKDFLPYIRQIAHGDCLEIGVRDGASTAAFLLGLEKNGGHLTSVDISDCSGLFEHPQWKFIHGDSKELHSKRGPNDDIFDMALVDGDHSREGFLADLNNCFDWVKNGGIIMCHDIKPERTVESHGGDYPSIAVGQEYFKFVNERGLMHWELSGAWGMGVLVVRKESK